MNTTNTINSKLYQEGNYTCVATNKYGTDVKHFVITAGKDQDLFKPSLDILNCEYTHVW